MNPYDQFDNQGANPYDQFDAGQPGEAQPHVQINVSPEARGIVGDLLSVPLGAARDAVVNTGNLGVDAAQAILSPLASAVGDSEGLNKAAEDMHGAVNSIPEVAHSNSAAIEMSRDIGRYVIGFLGAQKVFKSASMVAGAAGDFAVTGNNDTTMTDFGLDALVNQYPQLEGPVVDFLRSNDDSDLDKRFKAALDGVVLGKAAEGLFKLVKHVKGTLAEKAAEAAASKAGEVVTPGTEAASTLDDILHSLKGVETEQPREMFPELLKKETTEVAGDVAQQGTEQAVKVVEAPPSERGWNKAGTFRLDEAGKQEFVDSLQRHYDISSSHGAFASSVPDLPEGVFNYRNMDSSDAVKGTIDELTDFISGNIEKVTGGVESLPRTMDKAGSLLADMVGAGDYKKMLGPLVNMGMDARQITARFIAAKTMMQSMARDVTNLAKAIDSGMAAGDPTAQFELMRRIDILSDLTQTVKGAQTAAARITSSGRIRTKDALSPEEILKVINDGGGADNVRILARRLALADGDPAKVRTLLERNWIGKAIDIHNEFWMNGVLSGVKTHLTNITSSSINVLLRPAERIIGGAVDAGLEKVGAWKGIDAMAGTSLSTGSQAAMRQVREGMSTYVGFKMALWDSIKAAASSFKHETALLDPAYRSVDGFTHAIAKGDGNVLAEGAADKLMNGEFGHIWADNGIGGNVINAFGQFVRLPSRFLTSEDEFFKQLNYRSYVYSKAVHDTSEEYALRGLKPTQAQLEQGVQKRFDEAFGPNGQALRADALRWAQEATFTQDLKATTWMGNRTVGESVQTFANAHPALRSVFLPFVRTPLNLMRNAVDHTPVLGQLRKQFYSDIAAGGERRAMALGKLSTGSMLWMGALSLAAEGKIIGGGPADPQLNKTWRSDGRLPYSYVTADGSYVQFSKMDPFATILGIAADYHDIAEHLDQGTRESLAVSLVTALGNNVASKTYLKGLTQNLALISSGAQNRETTVQNAMYQRVASYIPSYMTLYNEDVEMKQVRSVMDAMKAKLPGWSNEVEAQRDMFGEKVLAPGGWLGKALNPFNVSNLKDPVRQEISRVADSPAGKAFLPVPTKDGNVDFTLFKNKSGQTAYDRLMELHATEKVGGKTLYERVADLIKSDVYQNKLKDGTELYPNSKRVELINNQRSSYKSVAMAKLLREFPEIAEAMKIDNINKAKVAVYGAQAQMPIPTPK